MSPASPPERPGDSTHSSAAERTERHALFRMCMWGALLSLWALWFLTLEAAGVLLLAFDSEVSVREGALWGAVQATWVAGIPTALLVAGHLLANGWELPRWRIRWLVVAAAAVLWCAIVALWILTAATD